MSYQNRSYTLATPDACPKMKWSSVRALEYVSAVQYAKWGSLSNKFVKSLQKKKTHTI